jgi:anti-sigma B factor antagonist
MSLSIETREADGVVIVDLVGRLTLGPDSSGQLRREIRDLLDQGKTQILLNLGDVSYIDSSGLGELVSSFATASSKGATVKLLNLQQKVKDLLQVTKLYTVFEVSDHEADAVASFS